MIMFIKKCLVFRNVQQKGNVDGIQISPNTLFHPEAYGILFDQANYVDILIISEMEKRFLEINSAV